MIINADQLSHCHYHCQFSIFLDWHYFSIFWLVSDLILGDGLQFLPAAEASVQWQSVQGVPEAHRGGVQGPILQKCRNMICIDLVHDNNHHVSHFSGLEVGQGLSGNMREAARGWWRSSKSNKIRRQTTRPFMEPTLSPEDRSESLSAKLRK